MRPQPAPACCAPKCRAAVPLFASRSWDDRPRRQPTACQALSPRTCVCQCLFPSLCSAAAKRPTAPAGAQNASKNCFAAPCRSTSACHDDSQPFLFAIFLSRRPVARCPFSPAVVGLTRGARPLAGDARASCTHTDSFTFSRAKELFSVPHLAVPLRSCMRKVFDAGVCSVAAWNFGGLQLPGPVRIRIRASLERWWVTKYMHTCSAQECTRCGTNSCRAICARGGLVSFAIRPPSSYQSFFLPLLLSSFAPHDQASLLLS